MNKLLLLVFLAMITGEAHAENNHKDAVAKPQIASRKDLPIGSFINGDKCINELQHHEYGHYLQSQTLDRLYNGWDEGRSYDDPESSNGKGFEFVHHRGAIK